ncbi:MAG: glycosyltransferase family 39 protein [Flavobacteriales bacterium]|nr:glycosyltransferase family 39 protein [Flavobacteriales bacterium]
MTRTDKLLLFALVALNAALKLLWLGVNDLAHDEPFTIYWSQRPLQEFFAMLTAENNPPLHFLLTKFWSHLGPFNATWLRVPSALASALTVWPLFLLAKRIANTHVALVAALLFTFSNYHYGFAHEVRAYALFTLLATLGMWLLVRGRNKSDHGVRAMLGLSALNTVLVYTHFFGWLAVGVQVLVVLLLPGFRQQRRSYLIGVLVTLGWFSPYLRIFLLRAGSSVSQGTWLEPPVAEELYNMVWRWSNAPLLAVIFLLLVVAAGVRDRMRSEAFRLALIWSLLPLLGMFLISQWVPLFLDRYLVYAAPGFALLVALSWDRLQLPQRIGQGLAAALVLGMAFTFRPWEAAPRQPSKVVAAVEAYSGARTDLQVVPAWYWLNYLAVADLEALRSDQQHLLAGERSLAEGFSPTPDHELIVVDATGGLLDAWLSQQALLRAHYNLVDSVEADHKVWVYRYR